MSPEASPMVEFPFEVNVPVTVTLVPIVVAQTEALIANTAPITNAAINPYGFRVMRDKNRSNIVIKMKKN